MIYSDIDFKFIKDNITGVLIKSEKSAIEQSLKNIIYTKRGSIPWNPRFGSNIPDFLFEKISSLTAMRIQNDLQFSIENWEPRVTLNSIDVIPKEDYNQYEINIIYTINTLNEQETTQIFLDIR